MNTSPRKPKTPNNPTSNRSRAWEVVPKDCRATVSKFIHQLADQLSGEAAAALQPNSEQLELLRQANFPSTERYYSEETANRLVDFLRNDLQIPVGLPDQITNEDDARACITTLLFSLKAASEFQPSAIDLSISEGLFTEDKKLEFILRYRCMLIDLLCLASHNVFMKELISKAKNGDNRSFLKLLRLDPHVLLGSDWAKNRLNEDLLRRRASSVIDITQKLRNPVLAVNTTKNRFLEIMTLVIFWPLGVGRYKYREILDFLQDLGLYKHLNENDVASEKSLGKLIGSLRRKGYLIDVKR